MPEATFYITICLVTVCKLFTCLYNCGCLYCCHGDSCSSAGVDSRDHMLLEYLVSWNNLIGCYHGNTILGGINFPRWK